MIANESGRLFPQGKRFPLASCVDQSEYYFGDDAALVRGSHDVDFLCAGREVCRPDYHVVRTKFDCLLIEFVQRGKGLLRFGRQEFELFPGVAFCYGMNQPHSICSDAKNPLSKCFIAFNADLANLPEPLVGLTSPGGQVRWVADLELMHTLFCELLREGRRGGPYSAPIASRLLDLIIYKAIGGTPARNSKTVAAARTYSRVLASIESGFAEISSLRDLRERVGFNESYLCRLFQRFGSETPIQCLTRYKLNRAADLLATGSLSITEVAKKVGYRDPFYFSRLFRKRYGVPPSEFRESGAGGLVRQLDRTHSALG